MGAVVLAVVTCWILGVAECARILAVMPMYAPSHLNVFTSVTKGLAERGHDVTFISSLPVKGNFPPNHRFISLFDSLSQESRDARDAASSVFLSGKSDPVRELIFLTYLGESLVNVTLTHPVFQDEINKPGATYDLIISELFFFVEAFVALGYKFNASVVAVNPFGTSFHLNDVMGNPINPSWVPNPFLGFSDHMNLYERTVNTLYTGFLYGLYYMFHIPKQQDLVDKFFPGFPTVNEMLKTQVALTLVNNHYTLSYPAPLTPSVIEVGGMHISDKPQQLPKDLEDIMNGAKHGVVYFSMGSNLRMQYLEKDKADVILGTLGSLDQQVLLKWDGPTPKVASNIRIIDWAPQAAILAHPNMRLFVSHGGLLSTQEAITHGVPLVGLPVFGDQQFNMLLAVNKGFCVKVDLRTITRQGFEKAIKEVINNPKYAQAAKHISTRFRSKPQKPLDTAMFWVEHVLQHGGDHLRPSSVSLSWYQVLLLDVLLVLLLPVLLLCLCCRALCCRRRKVAAPATNKKTD